MLPCYKYLNTDVIQKLLLIYSVFFQETHTIPEPPLKDFVMVLQLSHFYHLLCKMCQLTFLTHIASGWQFLMSVLLFGIHMFHCKSMVSKIN